MKRKEINKIMKLKSPILGITYESYAKQIAEIVGKNWGIDILNVPDFNIWQHFEAGVPIDDVIKIVTGTADSPFDKHFDVEKEFYDDFQGVA